MIDLDIKVDVESVIKKLEETGKSDTALTKKVLRLLGSKGVSIVRRRIRGSLRKRTGQLLRDAMYVVPKSKNKMYAVIKFRYTAKSERGWTPSTVKAWANEYGTIIRAKNSKSLVVQGSAGAFRRVKEATIPARPFFVPAISSYFQSGAYRQDVSAMVDKELAKLWG
jgi:hypothetical protein